MKFHFPFGSRFHVGHDTAGRSSDSDKAGLPPGSLVHLGKTHHSKCIITVTQYNTRMLTTTQLENIEQVGSIDFSTGVTWIHIDGLSEISVIAYLGQFFSIHPLVLEDIVNTHQRANLIEHEKYLYFVFKTIDINDAALPRFKHEQISLLLLDNCVITFKERADNKFQSVRNRLKKTKSRIRESQADYLAYALLDVIVDDYFAVVEILEESVLMLEDALLENSSGQTLQKAHQFRRELVNIRKIISPLRDMIARIQHTDSVLLNDSTMHYFEDVHEHMLRILDAIDSHREQIVIMQDIYLSSISNKMNETMKVLTIFASIFIPLTFIAGIYGMNFEYMPELHWRWAYPALWLLFIIITVALIVYFK